MFGLAIFDIRQIPIECDVPNVIKPAYTIVWYYFLYYTTEAYSVVTRLSYYYTNSIKGQRGKSVKS